MQCLPPCLNQLCWNCPLSPTLFNIYLDEIITKWTTEDFTGITLSKNKQLLTLLFADDQVIISNTDDNIQKAAHKLNQTITEYGLNVSEQKTKSMSFKGRDQIRSKVIIGNKIIEQVNYFNCSGSVISYENEVDIDNKLNKYLKITVITNNMFRPQKILQNNRTKLYRTLALPPQLYGSEKWTIKARGARRITAAEMKYVKQQQDTLGQITKQIQRLQMN
jgi:hypothetical protein